MMVSLTTYLLIILLPIYCYCYYLTIINSSFIDGWDFFWFCILSIIGCFIFVFIIYFEDKDNFKWFI